VILSSRARRSGSTLRARSIRRDAVERPCRADAAQRTETILDDTDGETPPTLSDTVVDTHTCGSQLLGLIMT
jgi:hypothetical protein